MSLLAIDERGNAIQAIRPGTTSNIAVSSVGATNGAAISFPVRAIRVVADVDCFIAIGPGAVATVNDVPLFAKQPEVFAVADGDRVSGITATGSGKVYITPATDFLHRTT